jgi:endo-1,4-beta-xylanase
VAVIAMIASSLLATSTGASTDDGRAGTKLRGLRHLGVRHDLLIGSVVDMGALATDPHYGEVLRREFSTVTAENAMKWQDVEPQRGVSDFAAADELVELARRNKQVVHGHVLVWHNQLPGWLAGGSFTPEELETILRDHVFEVAGHFRGRVRSWDVVNEPFNEDGTLRETIWSQALGPDHIEQALRWAHEADPNAKLYLNDYNLESLGPKSDAMYALAQDLLARGVPLHGVGFQGHLGIQYGFPGGLTENLQRFADLGLEVAFTRSTSACRCRSTRRSSRRRRTTSLERWRAVSRSRRASSTPSGDSRAPTPGCPGGSRARARPPRWTRRIGRSRRTSRCATRCDRKGERRHR